MRIMLLIGKITSLLALLLAIGCASSGPEQEVVTNPVDAMQVMKGALGSGKNLIPAPVYQPQGLPDDPAYPIRLPARTRRVYAWPSQDSSGSKAVMGGYYILVIQGERFDMPGYSHGIQGGSGRVVPRVDTSKLADTIGWISKQPDNPNPQVLSPKTQSQPKNTYR
jgi:hypothetical protein